MPHPLAVSLPAVAIALASAPAAAVDLFLLADADVPQTAAGGAPRPQRAGGLPEDMMAEEEEILVTAGRLPGQARGPVEPEIRLDPRDIRAFGATSLADLLGQLGPQLQSGAGRGSGPPLVLLNGQRVSGFQEIRNWPPEAILRVDILPEEAALAYGARPNQRVINFVLRPRFRSLAFELEAGGATAGGRPRGEAEASLLRVRGGTRMSLKAEHEREDRLLELERDVAARAGGSPFAVGGNLTASPPGGEIDPALSALAGRPVTIAAVPETASAGPPALADFLPGAGQPRASDERAVRTLLPRTARTVLGGTLAGTLGRTTGASVNARLEIAESQSLLGLAPATLVVPTGNPFSPFAADTTLFRLDPARPLVREAETASARLGLVLNGRIPGWSWSVIGNATHDRSDTATDRRLETAAVQQRLRDGDPRLNPFGPAPLEAPLARELARSRSNGLAAEAALAGTPFRLPAGDAGLTLSGRGEVRHIASTAVRAGEARQTDLGRTEGRLQASLDLPVASRRAETLRVLGNLSVNANLTVESLSDVGTLFTWGGGLNWSPSAPVRIDGSWSREEGAPSIAQLGNPVVATPNVRVFDQLAGETVDITRITGGNPELRADRRDVLRLGASLRPLAQRNLTISASYVWSRTDDPIAGFPALTPEVEAAFPERVRRGPDGRLIEVDARPVNFERAERIEIRYGINLFQQLPPTRAERARMAAIRAEIARRRAAEGASAPGGQTGGSAADGPAREPAPAGPPPGTGGPPPGMDGFGRGTGGPPPGAGPGGGLQLSLFHTVRLKEEIRIRTGVPVLDLLDGSAVGDRGGQPRHEVQLRAGLNRQGIGGRIELDWKSATEVRVDPSGGSTSPDDLFWSDLASVNLRMFVDLGQATGRALSDPWLRGLRLSLRVNNLFDAKPEVRNRLGLIPAGLEPDRLDPEGRRIVLAVRKLFTPAPAFLRRPA